MYRDENVGIVQRIKNMFARVSASRSGYDPIEEDDSPLLSEQ